MAELVQVSTVVDLLQVLWPDFIEVDGSVFLARAIPEKTTDPTHGLDRTGLEALLNHVHMSDLFGHTASRQAVDGEDNLFFDPQHPDFQLLCHTGKTLARMWFEKLIADFPDYDFRVYYTQEDNPIVRFHRVRPQEPSWLDELHYTEEIKQGKIIVYDTRNRTVRRGGA
jgi:hypothetical protein